MQYLHIRNIEKYHPKYKDRTLQWAKIYFRMVQGDPDCELIDNEVDWGRLVKFILLELQAQQPIPLEEKYLTKKGFNLKKRPIHLTTQMLHNFIEVVDTDEKVVYVDKEKDKEEDKDSIAVKTALDKVYKKGLNIYSLINKFKKERGYELPPAVLLKVCETFLKNSDKIENDWGWFIISADQASKDYFAEQNIREGEKHKNPLKIGEILKLK